MKLAFTMKVPEKSDDFKDFEEKVKYLAKIGYDGVELAIRDPKNIDAEKVKKLIDDLRLKVPTISTGEAYIKDGLSLSGAKKKIRTRAVNRIKNQIEFAAGFGACVTIGLIRGWLDKESQYDSEERFTDSVYQCSEFAEKNKVNLLLEPLNRYETDFINTLEEADDFIYNFSIKNLFILADTYHMNIEEKSVSSSILKNEELIRHVHAADNNRLAPGQGHLNFKMIFWALREINYQRFITAEILLKPSFEIAAFQTMDFLKSIIDLGGKNAKK